MVGNPVRSHLPRLDGSDTVKGDCLDPELLSALMQLFLTGGTGFIGSHVLVAALVVGHEVRALRRTTSSVPVIALPCQPQWCEGDLHTLTASQLEGVEAVLHLASAGVSPKKASWSELVQANVVGSLRLFELAAESGVRRCVVAGTSHEYGNAARRYFAIPPDAPLEPFSAYGASKAAAFQLLRIFSIEQGLELFYGRIFSVYGEGQFAGNFWPVSAVASHLLEACTRPDIRSGVPLVTNIGSGVAPSLLAFAKAEWGLLGATGRLLPASLPDRPDQIERYVPDLRGLAVPASPLT
jgi:UDP-glucose 4-epimerase